MQKSKINRERTKSEWIRRFEKKYGKKNSDNFFAILETILTDKK